MNTQAEHGNVPALTSLESLHFFAELCLAIGGVLSVGDEDDGNGGIFRHRDQPLFQFFKSGVDVGHATAVFLQVL